MPANDRRAPAQRGRRQRSWPAIDARIATATGVHAEDQRAVGDAGSRDARQKQQLIEHVPSRPRRQTSRHSAPVSGGSGGRRPALARARMTAIATRKTAEASTSRSALNVDFREIAEGELDDGEVAAPDDDHQEQQRSSTGRTCTKA